MSTRDHSPKRLYRTRLPRPVEPIPEVVGPRTKAELYVYISDIFHLRDAAQFYGIKDGEFITQNDEYGMTLQQCVDRIVHRIWGDRRARLLEFPGSTIALASALLYISGAAGDGLFLSVFNAMEIWDSFGDWASSVTLALTSCDYDPSEMSIRRALLRLAKRFSEKMPRAQLLQEFKAYDWEAEIHKKSPSKPGLKAAYDQTRVISSTHSPPWMLGDYDCDVRWAAHELDMDINRATDILLPALVAGLRNLTPRFWSAFVKSARAVHAKTPFGKADVAGAVAAYNNLPYRVHNVEPDFVDSFMLDMAGDDPNVPSQLGQRLYDTSTVRRFFTLVEDDE